MFIAVLFTLAKKWKPPKCPTTDERIKHVTYIYTMEYFSALNKEEIMSHGTTRMNLKDIVLSEIIQSQKDKYYMIPLIRGI